MPLIRGVEDSKTEARNAQVNQFIDRIVDRRNGATSMYDSAVIAGNGVGAHVFAAQLSKHPRFEGRVTIVGPPLSESRRLVSGVNVRGVAADFIGAAVGVSHECLLKDIAGPGPLPVAHRQVASMAFEVNGEWHFSRQGTWLGGKRGRREPVVYGVRNSRLVGGIRDLLAPHAVRFCSSEVESREHLLSFASGSNPLLVNASGNAGLLRGSSAKPAKLVLAVQMPLVAAPTGILPPLGPDTTFAPLIRRAGAIDVGFFTPFGDPLSPAANWYGIFARVVDAESGFSKDEEFEVMTEELYGVSASLGLRADDPQYTLARALVPAASWSDAEPSQPGTLDLKRMYSEGAPCFYADGIAMSAIGSVVGAEAIVHGADPDQAIKRALRVFRRHNFLWWVETNQLAPLADRLMRINVRIAMAYPHSAGANLWCSAA